MDHSELARYFRKPVVMNVETGSDNFRTVEGRVHVVEPAGLVLQTRSGPEVIELKDIIDIDEAQKPRRRRVQRRYVRVLTEDSNVRQHLADRHGIMVSVLNASDDDTLFAMHERLAHDDLGHRHGERPSRLPVDPTEAEGRIDQLGEYEDDEEELERDFQSI